MEIPSLLIGERDPFMRRALENSLLPHFKLTFAADGEEVLRLVRQSSPDLILLEALLPRKDGFQVCRELKSDPVTRCIPILFFTFLLSEERARLAGADAFLLKPLHQEMLIQTIKKLIKR